MRLIESGSFPMADITVLKRTRQIDENWAQALAAEFAERDMHNPVKILKVDDKHFLCQGGHRHRAHQIMGRTEIHAKVYEPTTAYPMKELELHEIDENLLRRELSALDRAAAISKRKTLMQELYGETRGGDRKSEKSKRQTLPFWSLSEELASKIGLSERTIRADVELYQKLSPKTRERVALTWLADNRAQLVQLSKVDHELQKAALDLLLAKEPKVTNVSGALALHLNKVDVKNLDEIAFARFVKLWGGASKKVKRQISSYITKAGA